jgi:hypothetical protein
MRRGRVNDMLCRCEKLVRRREGVGSNTSEKIQKSTKLSRVPLCSLARSVEIR